MKLASQRYEQIKTTIAEFLEDYDVRELPVDVFGLAKKMNIKIVFASKILKKHPKKVDKYLLFSFPNSYLYYDPETQKFIIFIDDIGTIRQRQRFSLAHELIHIILGHTEQTPENELEANFGATYLLAPTSLTLVKLGNGLLFNGSIVEKIFDVSEPEAQIIVRYNSNRISYCDFEEKHYEKIINNLLKDSFNQRIIEYQ